MGKIFGYFVLTIFFVAIVFSIITASGRDELLDKLDADSEAQVSEQGAIPEEPLLPQPMHLDPDMPLSYAIQAPDLHRIEVLDNPNENKIKDLLHRDIVVMAKVDTRKLNNPYYEVDEVLYLTIVGYTSTHFETIDTSKGKNKYFAYLITDFMRALNDVGGEVIYEL